MNTVTLTGRLTEAPEFDQFEHNGKPGSVAKFAVAVDRAGYEGADFIPIVAYNGLGAACADHLTKGRLVAVTGRLHQTKWTTDDGSNRSRLEVVASQVDFLPAGKPQT